MRAHNTKKKLRLMGFFIFAVFGGANVVYAETIVERLAGRILLQVEERGEAWYVDPTTLERIYLRDGQVAYQLLREKGLGITTEELSKIPIGLESRFEEIDSDFDGLSDKLEEAIGTNVNHADSDGDGVTDHDEIKIFGIDPLNSDTDGDSFTDGEEIFGGYDPLSNIGAIFDDELIQRLTGRILLQVESRGEAWYVNPVDKKRYYMADGEASYNIMRFLGLGITNKNLTLIPVDSRVVEAQELMERAMSAMLQKSELQIFEKFETVFKTCQFENTSRGYKQHKNMHGIFERIYPDQATENDCIRSGAIPGYRETFWIDDGTFSREGKGEDYVEVVDHNVLATKSPDETLKLIFGTPKQYSVVSVSVQAFSYGPPDLNAPDDTNSSGRSMTLYVDWESDTLYGQYVMSAYFKNDGSDKISILDYTLYPKDQVENTELLFIKGQMIILVLPLVNDIVLPTLTATEQAYGIDITAPLEVEIARGGEKEVLIVITNTGREAQILHAPEYGYLSPLRYSDELGDLDFEAGESKEVVLSFTVPDYALVGQHSDFNITFQSRQHPDVNKTLSIDFVVNE
jgi:hypothetical protein